MVYIVLAIPIYFFLVTFNALTAYWFYLSIIGFKAENDQLWAKRFFPLLGHINYLVKFEL